MSASVSLPVAGQLRDRQGRAITYLRLSVTDRCNFRCSYCSPAHWGGTKDLLTPAELERIVTVFARIGTRRVRLTGGEPLMRPDLLEIGRRVSKVPGIEKVALTTNASRLAGAAEELVAAGITQLNVSLDTLREDRFRKVSPKGDLSAVLAGIEAGAKAGFGSLKLNVVVMKGVNDDELPDLVRYAHRLGYTPRFIELMPFGPNAMEGRIGHQEVLDRLAQGGLELTPDLSAPLKDAGPARYYTCETGNVGLVSPLSGNFCAGCNRVRISAKGALRACLGGRGEVPLGERMRAGVDDATLEQEIRQALWLKEDGHQFGNPERDEQLLTMMGIGG